MEMATSFLPTFSCRAMQVADRWVIISQVTYSGFRSSQAAMLLNQGITDYAAQVDQTLANRGCLWLSIFCNKMGLAETLTSHGYCSADQFQEFCTGFNQSSPFFSLIDCGPGKEAADGKIKGSSSKTIVQILTRFLEFLRVFTQLPQTAMVVFGGMLAAMSIPHPTRKCRFPRQWLHFDPKFA